MLFKFIVDTILKLEKEEIVGKDCLLEYIKGSEDISNKEKEYFLRVLENAQDDNSSLVESLSSSTNLEDVFNSVAAFAKVSFNQLAKCVSSIDSSNNLNLKEVYDSVRLPRRATIGSAGYDFFAPFDIELQPGETIVVPTGIRCAMDEGYVLKIYPRSGLGFKYRCQLDNTVGIIDSDYYDSDNEGHIMIKITNDSKTGKVISIKAGDGFAQGIFTKYFTAIGDDVSTVRNGGFGHTTR
jgi:dUTP pyrophosphatase